jgi:predicted Zn-dependent protease
MSKKYEQTKFIGFTIDGEPITKQDLKKRAKKASERVKSGDYISQEEVDEKVKDW